MEELLLEKEPVDRWSYRFPDGLHHTGEVEGVDIFFHLAGQMPRDILAPFDQVFPHQGDPLFQFLFQENALGSDLEEGQPAGQTPYDVASVTKSITATLAEIARRKGYIEGFDRPIAGFSDDVVPVVVYGVGEFSRIRRRRVRRVVRSPSPSGPRSSGPLPGRRSEP